MNKIINLEQAEEISKELKTKNKTLVVTGGCFDILHIGHIKLFKESKKQGDCLLILLENDKTVRKLKGIGRPINSEKTRSEILASLTDVDYVLILPKMKGNNDYDSLIQQLKPDIITTTKGDPQGVHNERQAKLVGAKVVYVIHKIENKSTTSLARIIAREFK
jgi:rfaE bifunctional protein nucleotidyltransferase chain/domain